MFYKIGKKVARSEISNILADDRLELKRKVKTVEISRPCNRTKEKFAMSRRYSCLSQLECHHRYISYKDRNNNIWNEEVGNLRRIVA